MMQNAVYRYAECGLLPFHGRCMDVCPLKTSILPASASLFFQSAWLFSHASFSVFRAYIINVYSPMFGSCFVNVC